MFILYFVFFFNDTATTEIYTLSLHDALPISQEKAALEIFHRTRTEQIHNRNLRNHRSEEHTSELQSHSDLVCRLLLEKKKKLRTNAYMCNDPAQGTSSEITETAVTER